MRIRATAGVIDRWMGDEEASATDHGTDEGVPRYDDGTLHVYDIMDRHPRGPYIEVMDAAEARHLVASADYWEDFYAGPDGADGFDGPLAAARSARHADALGRIKREARVLTT